MDDDLRDLQGKRHPTEGAGGQALFGGDPPHKWTCEIPLLAIDAKYNPNVERGILIALVAERSYGRITPRSDHSVRAVNRSGPAFRASDATTHDRNMELNLAYQDKLLSSKLGAVSSFISVRPGKHPPRRNYNRIMPVRIALVFAIDYLSLRRLVALLVLRIRSCPEENHTTTPFSSKALRLSKS